jgi:hypothetical protein
MGVHLPIIYSLAPRKWQNKVKVRPRLAWKIDIPLTPLYRKVVFYVRPKLYRQSGLSCLANCIYDQTSSTCSTCSPKLASAWTDACDKGLTAPTENSTADIPTCRKEDISLIPSAQSFVGGGLNCLKDLSTFSTCLATNVPYYGQVSVDCKLCAESQTTSGGITADGCGAICMQEPSTSTECEKCASNLSDSFNQYCLGNVNSSVTPTMAVSATIVGVYFLLYM